MLLATLDHLLPPNLSRLNATGTEYLDREGRLLAMQPAPGGVWRFRTQSSDVSRPFRDLLIATEDRRFWWHPGVDPVAVVRAAGQWAWHGRAISGGSTLSMQAARLLEPRPRTLRSKAIEALRAIQLEWRYGKEGVLGIWLTLAPFGGNLEGVRAGARAWFGVSPGLLDPAQAALLIAIPRRPEALRPDRHPEAAARVRDRVLAEAAGVPVPVHRIAFPRHAAAALPLSGGTVETTLDGALQRALVRLARDRLPSLPEHAAIGLLVADIATHEIRAAVSAGAALDLTRAIRSPGSAMKPLIYALAFRDGLATPETRLHDLPRRFGAYAPENFDHAWMGQVTAAEALRRSLNLPAVALLDQLGPQRFAAGLRSAGFKLVLPKGADPALPLALGGAGTTMRDLAGMYAALGGDGQAAPLRIVPGANRFQPLVPPGIARLVTQVLVQPFPGGGPAGVAWKTGTSWGGRDAWAVGMDGRHVAVAWVGRPDGTPLPGATGRDLALPVLASVFADLPSAPLTPANRARTASAPEPGGTLRLLFPPPGATVSADGPVPIRVAGGRRPMTFLVDGAPLDAEPVERRATWQPGSPGFYRVTVLDADGAAVRAQVRVR